MQQPLPPTNRTWPQCPKPRTTIPTHRQCYNRQSRVISAFYPTGQRPMSRPVRKLRPLRWRLPLLFPTLTRFTTSRWIVDPCFCMEPPHPLTMTPTITPLTSSMEVGDSYLPQRTSWDYKTNFYNIEIWI